MKYFEENNLFAENQHGFRNNRSTVSALISLYTSLAEGADKNKAVRCMLYDLSAAFDCMDPEILCQKLKIYGFDLKSINWVKSYLTNRKQKVQIGDKCSKEMQIPFGCPQGSRISPILFIIMISDMPEWLTYSQLYGFADDSSSVGSADSVSELQEISKTDANFLLEFMAANKLVINPEKTALLVNLAGKSVPGVEVQIGKNNIVSKENEKFLE